LIGHEIGDEPVQRPNVLQLRGREPGRRPVRQGRWRREPGGRRTFGPTRRSDRPNKAFFFFNLERNLIDAAVVHSFPASAAAIATNYADATVIHALSTYARADYTAGGHNFSFRWQREVAPSLGEDFECCQTLDNRQVEFDENDRMFNVN
jgi:hypothetical protein